MSTADDQGRTQLLTISQTLEDMNDLLGQFIADISTTTELNESVNPDFSTSIEKTIPEIVGSFKSEMYRTIGQMRARLAAAFESRGRTDVETVKQNIVVPFENNMSEMIDDLQQKLLAEYMNIGNKKTG